VVFRQGCKNILSAFTILRNYLAEKIFVQSILETKLPNVDISPSFLAAIDSQITYIQPYNWLVWVYVHRGFLATSEFFMLYARRHRPSLSVIIPTLNEADSIADTVLIASACRPPPKEIIVVAQSLWVPSGRVQHLITKDVCRAVFDECWQIQCSHT
jgi:hypothetical protein